MIEKVAAVEAALADLSNAFYAVMTTTDRDPSGNLQWAEAAVDRALVDMQRIRHWLEGG